MNTIKILIVEDEQPLIDILRLYLEKEGFTVISSSSASEGMRLIDKTAPDILLLDIHLPDQNGFDVARKFREKSDGVLIFISGEKSKRTVLEGFEIGCDDFIIKPFDPVELIARIKANIRRTGLATSDILKLGNLTINLINKTVHKNNEKVDLFTKEKMLLFYLAQNPNQVFSAEQLYDRIWGMDSNADLKTVQVNLSTLRKKIEDNPKKPKYIQTERGFGYKLSMKN
ncbi:response regulator transcription factor [Siminovitchia fortis]|uniref:Response regulator transcription factor n=1 Tax=Siminovitchia fortis TaxID=254758 RepID=A0A443INA3_9BACI|nr:response regulator transcription factor [Siminovitchia fortis]RWR07280.1 response regulator transcription factor [Siminovitchia fortis]WHY81504.1 response regulator transcription factor [Siminovitchia fortis]